MPRTPPPPTPPPPTPSPLAPEPWPVLPGHRVRRRLGRGRGGDLVLVEGEAGWAVARRLPGGDRGEAARAVLDAALVLRHPHLVAAREHLTDAVDRDWVLLDLVEGGNLATHRAERGVLTAGEVAFVVGPVAEALGHLHASGVAHGGVDLARLLLSPQARPVLGDLCGARARTAGASPAAADDVFALGAVAWTCLAGVPPGPVWARTPLPRGLDAGVLDLLEACLAPEPRHRPSAPEVARAWPELAEPRPPRLGGGDDATRVTRRIPERFLLGREAPPPETSRARWGRARRRRRDPPAGGAGRP